MICLLYSFLIKIVCWVSYPSITRRFDVRSLFVNFILVSISFVKCSENKFQEGMLCIQPHWPLISSRAQVHSTIFGFKPISTILFFPFFIQLLTRKMNCAFILMVKLRRLFVNRRKQLEIFYCVFQLQTGVSWANCLFHDYIKSDSRLVVWQSFYNKYLMPIAIQCKFIKFLLRQMTFFINIIKNHWIKV